MPEYSEFSEFSYGYALVDNLARSGGWGGFAAAPRFISLSQEGSVGGGFDVALDFVAWPFFLQFKIPQIMRRRSAGMPTGFHTPYFRMHLRTERVNSSGMTQHEQLMELERVNPLSAFYVAPRFHTTDELDQHYLTHRVHDESEWFSLGGFDSSTPLTREPHRIAYDFAPDKCVVQSTPAPFNLRRPFKEVASMLGARLKDLYPTEPELWLYNLENTISSITSDRSRISNVDTKGPIIGPAFDQGSRKPTRRFLSDGEKNEFHFRLQNLAKSVRIRMDAELILAMPASAEFPPHSPPL